MMVFFPEILRKGFFMKFEQDIQFNRGEWPRIIESQHRLFALPALVEISDRLREDFHNGHAPGRTMPEIDPAHWATDALAAHANGFFGYDLPCLISRDRPAKGRIMLCAQDPLRDKVSAAPTVGTFFGIDSDYLRYNKKQHGGVWSFIRGCVSSGYDVLATDALKLFVGEKQLRKDPVLTDLCYKTLEDEIAAFSPDIIVAMGSAAEKSVAKVKPAAKVLKTIHPSWSFGAWYLDPNEDPSIGKAKAIERYLNRKVFESDYAPAPEDVG